MKLKSISLNNIRSYRNEKVEFPKGSILLSGDIGSGKTSILLAIEFALFGLQPGQRGSSLLKNGEKQGGVSIEFEIDNKDILIERTLKKAKGITQDYCAITIDDVKTESSVTELKDKVLDLLSYPKEFAKKQNLLYKFTVYTPQEEMKQIILQDPETRVNTLRHVFGIDKYKQVIENTGLLTAKLREEKRVKQALTTSLEQDKLSIVEKEEELETKHYNVASVEKELFLKKEKRKKIQEEKEEVSSQVEKKKELEKETDKTKFLISSKNDSLIENKKLILRIQDQIIELKKLQFDESEITKIELEIQDLKKTKIEINENLLDLSAKISSLSLKNQENQTSKEKISSLDMCPTCLQDVGDSYKSNVKNKLENDISKNSQQIESLTIEKQTTSSKLYKIEEDLSAKERQMQDLKIIKIKLQDLNEKQKRLEEVKSLNLSLEKDISLLKQHMDSLKTSIFDLKKYESIYEQKQKELDLAANEEKMAEIKVAELKKEIEVFSKQIEELKARLEKIEDMKRELDQITELESWLSKKFVPLLSFVEKNVMAKLKLEFTQLFQEWFSMLVSESFNVRLGDDFTPIIEQQDYEIDYAYLSGGERTAVALAYRLALNQVINSILSKIKTRDFMILDEPTDGFSDAQLDKMREVLEQLDVAQLIIVSHEQKIEGFVENVIRFKKEKGISKRT